MAEPVEETPETAAAALRERSGAPAVVPDNLPPGLYDPEGMEPIKADEIPADLDDSSDAEIKATPVGGSSRPAGPSGASVVGGAFCGPPHAAPG